MDVTAKEQAVADRLEKERSSHGMSRTSSRTAIPREREHHPRPDAPPSNVSSPSSPHVDLRKSPAVTAAPANVRSSFSFAAAAKNAADTADVDGVTESIDDVQI